MIMRLAFSSPAAVRRGTAGLLFGRALPLAVFGFIVAIQAQLAIGGLAAVLQGRADAAGQLHVLNRILTVAFFAFILAIYLVRGPASGRDHNPLAVAAAMVGSFILFSLPLVPGRSGSSNPAVLALSNLLLTLGLVVALYSLSYLRGRFSLVPEARGLVTTGPYRLVRHPIYLGELLSALGLVLPTVPSQHLAIFAIFVVAQLIRMHFEEKVLGGLYPQYRAYARTTSRLIPFLY